MQDDPTPIVWEPEGEQDTLDWFAREAQIIEVSPPITEGSPPGELRYLVRDDRTYALYEDSGCPGCLCSTAGLLTPDEVMADLRFC